MSDTYKNKHYFQAREAWSRGEDATGISQYWDYHRFSSKKTPQSSRTAKYIIQVMGHHRRRASERAVIRGVLAEYGCNDIDLHIDICADNEYRYLYEDVYPAVDSMRYEKKLNRVFSNVWDYY